MSDLAPDASLAPESTGLPTGEPAPTQVVDTSTEGVQSDGAPSTDADPWDDPAVDTFARPYVERLRQEAAERRVAVKPFHDAFDGYEDSDRDTLLAFAQTLRQDPATAAQWMQQQAQAILGEGEGFDQLPDGDGEGEGFDPDTPLTAAQLDQILAQREQAQAQQQQHEAQIASIIDEAKELGYDPESKDPVASARYVGLLHLANTHTGYDLKKAHEILQGQDQQAVDNFVAQKRGDVDTTATTPPQTGASARQEKPIPQGWGDDFSRYIQEQVAAGRS